MKCIIFLLLLSFGSVSLWANNHNGSAKDISLISRLLPDNVTQSKVKEILGTATFININNKTGEESWHYKNEDDNTDYYFRWDNRNGLLKTISYSCSTPQKQSWSNQNLGGLEMGATTPGQVMNALGAPNSLNLNASGDQWLKYIFAGNNEVSFQFKGGVLTSIHVSAK